MPKNRLEGARRPKFLRTAVVVGVAMAAVVGGGMAVAADRVAAPQALLAATAPSDFVGITPVRVLDTRPPGRGGPIGVPAAGPLGQGQTIDVAVAGIDGIPADAVSVAVNVTLDEDATLKSFLTVWPAGEPRPTNASANNAEPGLVSPNSGLFKLGAGGKLSVFNQQGAVHVVIDVTGYFVAAPTTGTGPQGPAGPAGPIGPGPNRSCWPARGRSTGGVRPRECVRGSRRQRSDALFDALGRPRLPAGTTTSGNFRFSCSANQAPCKISYGAAVISDQSGNDPDPPEAVGPQGRPPRPSPGAHHLLRIR